MCTACLLAEQTHYVGLRSSLLLAPLFAQQQVDTCFMAKVLPKGKTSAELLVERAARDEAERKAKSSVLAKPITPPRTLSVKEGVRDHHAVALLFSTI